MRVIVVVCVVFGLTVSETKIEIVCLRAKGMLESTATFSVRQRARCTTTRTSLHTSGETSTTMPTCPSRSTGAHATHGAASGSTPSNCTTDRAQLRKMMGVIVVVCAVFGLWHRIGSQD